MPLALQEPIDVGERPVVAGNGDFDAATADFGYLDPQRTVGIKTPLDH